MKDYRTWWRKLIHLAIEVENMALDYEFQTLPETNHNESDLPYADFDQTDCIVEQIWAIREGLADEPGAGREGE